MSCGKHPMRMPVGIPQSEKEQRINTLLDLSIKICIGCEDINNTIDTFRHNLNQEFDCSVLYDFAKQFGNQTFNKEGDGFYAISEHEWFIMQCVIEVLVSKHGVRKSDIVANFATIIGE